ncbi:MAG: hypothetical protein LJE59_02445 [Chromatiaceae bacterium]|nr:hypothetical protein [Chromatiaceae bacterium]
MQPKRLPAERVGVVERRSNSELQAQHDREPGAVKRIDRRGPESRVG